MTTKPKESMDACLACSMSCETCITECIESNLTSCIPICRDCADICALCARFEARNSHFRKRLQALCAEVCKACALECAKHAKHMDCCKICEATCEKCAALCEEAAHGL